MVSLIDNKKRKEIEYYIPDKKNTEKLANFFTLFADSSRVRLLSLLCISELCVSDITTLLGMNQTTVSHQLKLLKDNGAISQNRQGKVIFYSIANTKINDVLLFGVEYLGY